MISHWSKIPAVTCGHGLSTGLRWALCSVSWKQLKSNSKCRCKVCRRLLTITAAQNIVRGKVVKLKKMQRNERSKENKFCQLQKINHWLVDYYYAILHSLVTNFTILSIILHWCDITLYWRRRKTLNESMSGFIAMVCKNVLGVMMGNKYEGKMFISGNYDHLFRYNKHRNDYCGKYIWLCRHFSMQKCT